MVKTLLSSLLTAHKCVAAIPKEPTKIQVNKVNMTKRRSPPHKSGCYSRYETVPHILQVTWYYRPTVFKQAHKCEQGTEGEIQCNQDAHCQLPRDTLSKKYRKTFCSWTRGLERLTIPHVVMQIVDKARVRNVQSSSKGIRKMSNRSQQKHLIKMMPGLRL